MFKYVIRSGANGFPEHLEIFHERRFSLQTVISRIKSAMKEGRDIKGAALRAGFQVATTVGEIDKEDIEGFSGENYSSARKKICGYFPFGC
jgi:hypothetical protein